MLAAAVWVLTLAVAAGSALALWHLRDLTRPPLVAGIAHGIVGLVGLTLLLLVLRGPVRGVATGVAAFGPGAAILFVAAAATGSALLLLRRKSLVMAIHAGIAITGYALLLAWASLG